MSEISKYEAQVKKMQGLCDEHELVYRFDKTRYPITFVIRPTQGVGAQMSMLEAVEDKGYTSPDAYMKWAFQNNELRQVVDGGAFTIDVALRKKIESILLKMIMLWQQYFFRDVIEKDSLKRGMMPVINEDDAGDGDSDDSDGDSGDEDREDGEASEERGEPEEEGANSSEEDSPSEFDSELIDEATKLVRLENKATVALLQRRLKLGYSAASRLMERLEELGVVGPFSGSAPREVLPFDIPEDAQAG